MKEYALILLVLLLPLCSLYSQDTSSLYNQAYQELDNLELKSNQQEAIILNLLQEQKNSIDLLKSVESSLAVAEVQSLNLEISLKLSKQQILVYKIVVGILGTIVIGEALYIMIPK